MFFSNKDVFSFRKVSEKESRGSLLSTLAVISLFTGNSSSSTMAYSGIKYCCWLFGDGHEARLTKAPETELARL